MPKVVVKLYDENGNVIREVPYGENGITGASINGERQQVYKDTDKQGNEIYVSDDNFSDPYIGAGKQIERAVSIQAPKVSVENGKMVISGSQEVLQSPLAQQMRDQLQTLKGSDISSDEVQNALNVLNEEVKNSVSDQMIKMSLGWTPDQYKDYQYTVQTVRTTNPMASSNKVKGYNKDGEIEMKTPQEWVDYYRKVYSTDERTNEFLKSLVADDPYSRTMALILSGGSMVPTYGWDAGEQIGQGLEAFRNQMAKFPYGIARRLNTSKDVARVEDIIEKYDLPLDAFWRDEDMPYNEIAFEEMKKSIEGKSWSQLSDVQKAFLIELNVTRESSSTPASNRGMIGFEREVAKDLENLFSDDEATSKKAVENVLTSDSYERFAKIRDDFNNIVDSDRQNIGVPEERLSKNAIWSGTQQAIGNFAGVIGRFWWEALVGKALTGASVNRISEVLGEKIVNALGKIGFSPASSIGKGLLRFSAELAGTIPEDIVQTAIDNIVTYNDSDNANLLNPEQMSDQFKTNLIFMSIFNGVRAGWSAVKRAKIAKELKKISDLSKEIDIGAVTSDAEAIARSVDNGGEIKIDGDRVYVENADGTTTDFRNTTPEQGRIIQQSLFDWAAKNTDADTTVKSNGEIETPEFDDAARAISDSVDNPVKAADEGVGTGTVKVEVDTPDGKKTVEAQDFNFKNSDEVIDANLKITPTKTNLKLYRLRGLSTIMREFKSMLREFHNKFGDVTVSDFDWVRRLSESGYSPDKIIGTIDPTTNRVMTQNTINAMKWWAEQPIVKKLRMASLKSLGMGSEDYNILGYLPQTDYDPTVLPLDEVLFGQLWKKSTGKSVVKDGKYIGYGGTFEGRFKTFASNMLWDIRNKEVIAAKIMEEAELDGKKITPEQAMKAAEAGQTVYKTADKAKSTKSMNKALESQGDFDKAEWDKINEEVRQEAPKCGAGKAIHDGFSDVYMGANSKNVTGQAGSFELGFNQMSDNMKRISIGDGMSMYDWGGAQIIYGYQDAVELVGRWEMAGAHPSQFRGMLIDHIQQYSHRSSQYAEAVADRIIERIANSKGGMTKGNVINELGKAFRSEGMSRLRKWLVMAKYDQFNDATKKYIDTFLFNKMQLDSVTGNAKVKSNLTKLMNKLTEARYDAIFYGNVKNALLQISELNRLFVTFKWGDVAKMFKRLATDADFRDRVNLYVEAVAPRTSFMDAEIYGSYQKAAEGFEVGEDGVTFNKIKGTAKEVKKVADDIGLAPINTAESMKNRMMVAAILQEAESKNISGNELLPYMRSRFERVALAADEMGRIGLASNPLAKPLLFLQNFQIRELGMHYYNIKDATGMVGGSKFKKAAEFLKYASKVIGTKMATTLLLSRIGYSAAQTMGFDPFGLLNNYNQMDEDEMNWWDKQISGGILTPIFAGGMMSLVSDLYFMARDAYEDSVRETVSEEAEANLENPFAFRGLDLGAALGNAGYWKKLTTGFIPGSTFGNRIGQMNEMMNSGWATSATGNKMYTAPEDPWNIIKGYLFGRSATQNALNYSQNYGNDLLQTLGRMNPFRNYNEFDPIDTKNYTDWFDGSENDMQQFEKGRKYFQQQRDAILDAYRTALSANKSATKEDVAEAKNDMMDKLNDLWEQLSRFVDAYEDRNGSITQKMVKSIISLLDVDDVLLATNADEDSATGLDNYSKALERYSQFDLPNIGTYTGPSTKEPEKEVKYQGSPQWRTASRSKYDLYTEAVNVLKQVDVELKDLRNKLKTPISDAYEIEDYDTVTKLQKQYLDAFDNVVSPIVALYGTGILSSTDVVNQLKDMLSTGTSSRS